MYGKYAAMGNWVHTIGQPYEYGIGSSGGGYNPGKSPAFKITTTNVKYQYWVNGERFVGHTRLSHESFSRNMGSFDIYYDPGDPGNSALNRKLPWGVVLFWMLAAAASFVALYGWLKLKARFESARPNK